MSVIRVIADRKATHVPDRWLLRALHRMREVSRYTLGSATGAVASAVGIKVCRDLIGIDCYPLNTPNASYREK